MNAPSQLIEQPVMNFSAEAENRIEPLIPSQEFLYHDSVSVAAEIATRQAVVTQGPELGRAYRLALVAEYVQTVAVQGTAEVSSFHRPLYFNGYRRGDSPDEQGYSPDAVAYRREQINRRGRMPWLNNPYGHDDRFAKLYRR